MKSATLYRIMCGLGVGIMLSAFVVLSDSYPWYYEVLLFDVGLALWLFSRWKKKKMEPRKESETPTESQPKKYSWLFIVSVTTMLTGALYVFVENESPFHDPLQIVFVIGALSMALTLKKARNIAMLLVFGFFSSVAQSQDYTSQVNALKQSFENKDIQHIQPFLSEELKFDPMPVSNTIPVLNNILTRLPYIKLESIESSSQKVTIKYEFQGLGERTSDIHFDAEGKIVRVELIENLIKMQMEQQRRMASSVQQPGTNEVVEKYTVVKVTIPTSDGLSISGNLYEVDENAEVILLCHQAGYNKAEYNDIAPRLNELGYNCLAIDQRSGGSFAAQENETASQAKSSGMEPTMFDAQPDLNTSIDYLAKKYGKKVIVWGSSYSSSLAIFELAQNPSAKAAISFSPGDYFGDAAPSLSTTFSQLKKPYLVTSSKAEAEALSGLLKGVDRNKNQIHFIPESEGFHGSRALWIGQEGADEYWSAVTNFLALLE